MILPLLCLVLAEHSRPLCSIHPPPALLSAFFHLLSLWLLTVANRSPRQCTVEFGSSSLQKLLERKGGHGRVPLLQGFKMMMDGIKKWGRHPNCPPASHSYPLSWEKNKQTTFSLSATCGNLWMAKGQSKRCRSERKIFQRSWCGW